MKKEYPQSGKHSFTWLAAGMVFLCSAPGFAADKSWNTSSQTNWATAGNWSPSGVPATTDDIVTPTLFGNILVNTVTPTVASWTYNSPSSQIIIGQAGSGGSSLTISGNLTKQGAGTLTFRSSGGTSNPFSLAVNGDISVSEGVLSFGNQSANDSLVSFSAGSLTATGGTISFNGRTSPLTVAGAVTLSGSSTINIKQATSSGQSGTLSVGSLVSSSSTAVIQVNNNATFISTGNLTLEGASGVSTFAGTIQKGGTVNNVLNLTKNGGATQILSGANTYTGTTTVNAGSLLIDGTHTSAGAYTVSSGTLGGSGSITTAGNASITINGSGKLAPGSSADNSLTATLGTGGLDISGISSGALVFELGVTGSSDQFTLASGTLIAGTLNFEEFSFSQVTGFGTGTYKLFDLNSAMTGTIGTASGSLGGGYTGMLSIGTGADVNDILLTVVPEPSTCLLALFGAGSMLFRRKRTSSPNFPLLS